MTTVEASQAVLDNAVWASLRGPHAKFAEAYGKAVRYQTEVAPFHALHDPQDPHAWSDLAELTGPAAEVAVAGPVPPHHPGWVIAGEVGGVQFVDESLRAEPFDEAHPLGPPDVPEILDLIERTQPGPFRRRTIELGNYLGVRRDGKLIAMAGERLHPPGWTEISAVCTDPAHRGQGLATRLVRAVAAGIRDRGEVPFLHTSAANTNAIRLYESIGFHLRRRTTFALYKRA
ncbi:GNAT family N-acetyltransferase [Actinoplanes sp. TRM 88003]|uniref:GNAT family N-acetyltransferase n=1 Tax=Paractinoplanes aksuensis TaxID=2939490 RepID=A0ABT1DHF7_9ACTN|nr:GNAT family N-acetyltransferase [Actinoplanes aksuensis]MCO8270275.1 GNAT family N-acetyltransferase [Actinoplanes aksuensis]